MKNITENFTKLFGKVMLATMFATALFTGGFFTAPSVADAGDPPKCNDGIDNETGGFKDDLIDALDPGCWTDPTDSSTYDPNDNSEYPQCGDDLDNDGDGLIDYEDPQCHTDGNASNTSSWNAYDEDESAPEILGSITVCKVIIDGEENIVNGSENAGTFLIPGISPLPIPDTSFTTPLSLTHDFLTENGSSLDTQCTVHADLPLGSYWYGEETITGDNWLAPKYNDQFTDTVTTLGNFYPYTTDGTNQNADGNIVISENRPDRTLVVLNQYEIPEPEPITIVATKIVCDDESYLPNWGTTHTPIDENTAANFLNDNEHCSIAQDWQFQWAPQGTGNPGDNTGATTSPWTTFTESIQIGLSELSVNDVHVWVREVWNDAYVPFTHPTGNNVSAEIYCHTDTINYDNYDRVDGIQAGRIYYCVGFNALQEVNEPPVITVDPASITLTIGDSFDPTDHATAYDEEDGDITGGIVVSGDTVDTNTVGTYYVVYDVVDSESEPAETKTLEVIVEDQTPNLCRVDLDVMIVMDRSGSMDDDGTNPAQPLTDAKNAANSFVGKLGLDDQSGLVSYGTVAELKKGLSNDHSATQSAITALTATGATNVGDAIALANDEFSTSSQTLKIEILLSDGEANKYTDPATGQLVGPGYGRWQPAVDFAESKAQEAADAGIKIFTIGLGSNIDATMLQNIASTTGGMYYYAATSEDLDEIFDEIAWDVCHGSISGCKYEAENYEDMAGIGTLSGWEIVLNGDANLTQFTNGDGCYKFSGLTAGNYTVSEATDQGVDYVQTYPQCPSSYSIILDDEENVTGKDFVNYLPTCGNDIVDSDYGEECDGGEGCSDQCLFEEEQPTCSVSGYKYNKTGSVIVNWLIGLAQVVECVVADEEWADSVVNYSQGTGVTPENQVPVGKYRGYSWQALDVAQRDDTVNFVSLGMGGELILKFDNLILNGTGDDIEVVETSFGDPAYDDYKEKAKIYASQNNTDWSYLGIAYLDEYFDLDNGTLASDETTPFVLDWVNRVKIIDTSIQQGDGYDVDGVKALHCGNYETVTSTTTDASGEYCFADVVAGDYAVYEEMKDGWDIWKVMTGQTVLDYFVDSFFDVFVEIEVVDGETTNIDFYNQEENVPPENNPPVADAGVDQTVTLGTEVSFDGSNSTDIDGTIISYDWNFDDGGTGVGATTTHTYSATGTYDVILTVTDDDNAIDTDEVVITVVPEEDPIGVTINELMWMGSATSTADEWVELKNNTALEVDLDGCRLVKKNGNTIADLEGQSIDANGYLVVSRKSREESNIDTETQELLSHLALSNSDLKIELYCGETLIDTAGDGNAPLAGDNGDPKKSMQKCGEDWTDALVGGVANNWDANATEFGTPGLANVCEFENQQPVILGADNPLVFYAGDTNTELELEALARLGVTATDTQDIIPAGDIVITGLGGVSTSTVGTTTISYDVDDYGNPALSAQTVVREVRTVTQCSDGLDNDSDTLIDALDPGCWIDPTDSSTYDPQDNDEFYTGPVEYPQCSDDKDNDGDGLIDYDDPGCHTDGDVNNNDSYDPEDDNEDNTPAPFCGDGVCNGSETCSTCSQDCGVCATGGGGGGGGYYPMTIIISHEDVDYLGDGIAIVTWKTNVPATSQVVYGDDSLSKSDLSDVPEYGYDSVNGEVLTLGTTHSMTIEGLTLGTQYYFRPVSDKSGMTEVIGKEVTYTFVQVPAVCNYLLEYIKLGANNNPVEVEKLERFLNEFEGEDLPVNGIYEQADYEAVKRFQIKYREDILDPWNHTEATGYVYITTKKKINELYCERDFPLTGVQEAEVMAFSALIGSLPDTTAGADIDALDVGNVVGVADSDSGDSNGVLADAGDIETSDEVEDEDQGLLANILGTFGFGDDEDEEDSVENKDETDVLADNTKTDDVDEEDSRNLASTLYSGVMNMATSFWFILLLVVIAAILFFRIRGAKGKE